MQTQTSRVSMGRRAFTLIEMLIVIVILGVLAMVIIPQISTSTDDAKLSTLRTNLTSMRNAVELYYAQHSSMYPATNGTYQTFLQQLTRYTDAGGTVSATKDTTYKFGPYLKGGNLAMNPFNNKNDAVIDASTADITVKASDGTTGWKFYAKTGVLIANDGAHDNE